MGPLKATMLLTLLAASPVFACTSKTPAIALDAATKALPAHALQVTSADLVRLEITRPGAEPVTLRPTNGRWDIVAPITYGAKLPSVESMLAVLAEIEIVRHVAAKPAPEHRLALDARVLVKTWTSAGTEQAFFIGASIREETFVQRFGEEQVFAVRGACRRYFDLSLDQLRAPAITNLDVTDVDAVRFVNSSGTLDIVPSKEDPTRFALASPSISNFNSERASKNVAVLAKLFAEGFVDPPLGKPATGLFDEDTARIEVSLRAVTEPFIIYIGTRTKNGRLHLRTSASEQLYLVSGHLGSSLMPKPSHFARTDAEMRALQGEVESAKLKANDHAVEHKHGNTRPTQVPPELMKELRALAAEQRS